MIDFTKPVQTRSGKPVRILCTDRKGFQPIVALVSLSSYEPIYSYNKSGSFYMDERIDSLDLVNVPQRHKHADLMIAYANDTSLEIEWRPNYQTPWAKSNAPIWDENYEYRIKPR